MTDDEGRPVGNPWFGEPWPREDYRAAVCENDALRIRVPVGLDCYMCETTIVASDRGTAMAGIGADGEWSPEPMFAHIECLMRNTMGCFDLVSTGSAWTPDHVCSDSGSYRADALKVWNWIQTHGR